VSKEAGFVIAPPWLPIGTIDMVFWYLNREQDEAGEVGLLIDGYRCDESKVERRLPLWYFLEHG
jgi:hypothetical protein